MANSSESAAALQRVHQFSLQSLLLAVLVLALVLGAWRMVGGAAWLRLPPSAGWH